MVALSIAAFLVVLSIDSPPPNDNDLQFTYTPVTISENGFRTCNDAASLATVGSDVVNELTTTWNSAEAEAALVDLEDALTLWKSAVKFPVLQVPEVSSFDDHLPYLKGWRNLARVASVKARLLAEQGKVQEAIDLACLIIEFGHKQERAAGPLINYLVAIATKSIGISRLRQLVHDHDIPTEYLRKTIARLETCDCDRAEFQDALRIEYTIAKNTLEAIDNGGPGAAAIGAPKAAKIPFMFKKNETLALFVEHFRTSVKNCERGVHDRAAVTIGPPSKRDLLSGNFAGKMLYGLMAFENGRALERLDRIDVELDLLQLQMAVKAYRNEHSGEWPESLDELTPRYVSQVPTDRFSKTGSPLRYDSKLRFVYTVGPDGQDNGGLTKNDIGTLPADTIHWREHDDPGLFLDWSMAAVDKTAPTDSTE